MLVHNALVAFNYFSVPMIPMPKQTSKWYSRGLTAKMARKLEKQHGKITNVDYGLTDDGSLALFLEYSLTGSETYNTRLGNQKDIKALLTTTGIRTISELKKMTIEIYHSCYSECHNKGPSGYKAFKGISIDK